MKIEGEDWGSDMHAAEHLLLDGKITRLPEWHVYTYMYEEEVTPEILRHLHNIRALEKSIEALVCERRTAHQAKNNAAEMSACLKILDAWYNFSPKDKYCIERFEADFFVDRCSIIQMQQKKANDAIETVETYIASDFLKAALARGQAATEPLQNGC